MLSFEDIRKTHKPLAEALTQPADKIELDRTALLIAQEHCPETEVQEYLRRIDEYAGRARPLIERAKSPEERISRPILNLPNVSCSSKEKTRLSSQPSIKRISQPAGRCM